jgi:hypothetical protein
MEQKVTTDTILNWLKERVESKASIPQDIWLDSSFKLNLLLDDEEHQMEVMRQEVAKGKLDILRNQEKRNVAAAEMETEATDEYRLMREQEHRVDRIKEFIRIAKKNAEQGY